MQWIMVMMIAVNKIAGPVLQARLTASAATGLSVTGEGERR